MTTASGHDALLLTAMVLVLVALVRSRSRSQDLNPGTPGRPALEALSPGVRRRRPGPRSLLLGLAVLLTAAALVLFRPGVTFARLSASTSTPANTLMAGTVTLSSSAIANCPISNITPTAAPSTCTFNATYSGNVSAYLGLDVTVESQAGSGGTSLFNPSDGNNDVQITISSTTPAVSAYTVPTTAGSCPGGAPSGSTCYTETDDWISATPFTSSSSPVHFSITAELPTTSTNGYQSGTAEVLMTVHATQAGHQPSVSGCSPGGPCTPSGFNWS